tara:strand:+ start:524 stop:688 length:165 start_codon:yes stop_codon:yes gene_type:complete
MKTGIYKITTKSGLSREVEVIERKGVIGAMFHLTGNFLPVANWKNVVSATPVNQ